VIHALRQIVANWSPLFLWYFGILNLFYGILFALSVLECVKHWTLVHQLRFTDRLPDAAFPPISIVVAAYDEEAVIADSVSALLRLDYPAFEVIVVNDGSSDDTMGELDRAFDLHPVPPAFQQSLDAGPVRGFYRSGRHPALLVVDKGRGRIPGRAAPLNVGLNAARYPYFMTVDADTVVNRGALRQLARSFFVTTKRVVGSGGTIRVANGVRFRDGEAIDPRVSDRWVVGMQVPEYFRGFLFGRLAWNRLGGNLLISGAFSMYDKRLAIEVGGFRETSITEDLDLTVRMHRRMRERGVPYAISFVPDPVAWTEVPRTVGILGNQRERWHRGLMDTIFRNLRMFLNWRYGPVGLLGFPYYVVGEMLEPVAEAAGYVVIVAGLLLGVIDVDYMLLFAALAFGYQILLSVSGVILELLTFRVYPRTSDYLKLIGFALVEPFGFRQLTVWWRLKGIGRFLLDLGGWNVQERYGFEEESASAGES